jgi:hypothetical protein
MATQPGGSVTSRAASESRTGPANGIHPTGAKFRHGLLQLMIHTIDPLHDGKIFRSIFLIFIFLNPINADFHQPIERLFLLNLG